MIKADTQRKKTTEFEASRIRDALREFSGDEGRKSISDLVLATGKSVSAAQVASWLQVFVYDQSRVHMIRKLAPVIEDPWNLVLYGKCMRFDEGREIMCKLASIPPDDKVSLDAVWEPQEKTYPTWNLSNNQFVLLFAVAFFLGVGFHRFFGG